MVLSHRNSDHKRNIGILHLVLSLSGFVVSISDPRHRVYLHLHRSTSVGWLSIIKASLTTRLTGTWTNWTSTTSRWCRTWSNDKRCRTRSRIRIRCRTGWIPPTNFPSIAAYTVFILGSTIITGRRSIGTDFIQIWFILGADVFNFSSSRSTSRSWGSCW